MRLQDRFKLNAGSFAVHACLDRRTIVCDAPQLVTRTVTQKTPDSYKIRAIRSMEHVLTKGSLQSPVTNISVSYFLPP